MMLNTNMGLEMSHRLKETSKSIAKSLKRLSTGKRINSPADDPAGFSVSINFSAQIRGLKQANLNINQARGLIQTADAALSNQLDLVQRMRDLAIQGSNGSLSSAEREALNNEVQSLMMEFKRITAETEFNGTKLLDGSFGAREFQVGAYHGNTMNLEIASLQASNAFVKTVGLGSFQSAVTYAVGDAPSDLVFVDLNGDGMLDVASIEDSTSDSISIRFGVGDGSFGARMLVATGSSPAQIRAGDVNGDGIQDLVVSDNSNTIDVFLGNGDGSFQARTTYSVTDGAEFVLADLNNDGALDIISATSASSISVLMNNGDGTFQSEATHATNVTSNQIKAADFDNDGNMDILITAANSGTSQVLRGDGSGNFSALGTFATGGTSANNIVGDFNNDGIMDVLVAYGSSSTVAVRLGLGDGTFSSAANFTAEDGILDMAIGDFNNDGNLDFIGRTASKYMVHFGDGNGGFTTASTGSLSATALGLQVGDLNGDGVDDFAVVNSAATDSLSVFLGNKKTTSAEADVNLRTAESSQKLIGILDDAIQRLIEERSHLSSALGRLDSIESYNYLQTESLTEARSLMEETDIAYETAELTRLQILEQAQISVMSQVNLNMQVVLGLLQA